MASTSEDEEMPLKEVVLAWRANPERPLHRDRPLDPFDQVVGLTQQTTIRQIAQTEPKLRQLLKVLARCFGKTRQRFRTDRNAGPKPQQLAKMAQELFFHAGSGGVRRGAILRCFRQDIFGANVDRFVKTRRWPEEPSSDDDSRITACTNTLDDVDYHRYEGQFEAIGGEHLAAPSAGTQGSSNQGARRVTRGTSAPPARGGASSSGVQPRVPARPAAGSYPARAARIHDTAEARGNRTDQRRTSTAARREANNRSLMMSVGGTSVAGSGAAARPPPPPSTGQGQDLTAPSQAAAAGSSAPVASTGVAGSGAAGTRNLTPSSGIHEDLTAPSQAAATVSSAPVASTGVASSGAAGTRNPTPSSGIHEDLAVPPPAPTAGLTTPRSSRQAASSAAAATTTPSHSGGSHQEPGRASGDAAGQVAGIKNSNSVRMPAGPTSVGVAELHAERMQAAAQDHQAAGQVRKPQASTNADAGPAGTIREKEEHQPPSGAPAPWSSSPASPQFAPPSTPNSTGVEREPGLGVPGATQYVGHPLFGSPYGGTPAAHHGTTFGGGSMAGAHFGSPVVGQHHHAFGFGGINHYMPTPSGHLGAGAGPCHYGGVGGGSFFAGGGGFHHPGYGPGFGSPAGMAGYGGPGLPGPAQPPHGWPYPSGAASGPTWPTGVAASPPLLVPKTEPGNNQDPSPVHPHTPAPVPVQAPPQRPQDAPEVLELAATCRQLALTPNPTVGHMRKTIENFDILKKMLPHSRQWAAVLRDLVAVFGWSKSTVNRREAQLASIPMASDEENFIDALKNVKVKRDPTPDDEGDPKKARKVSPT